MRGAGGMEWLQNAEPWKILVPTMLVFGLLGLMASLIQGEPAEEPVAVESVEPTEEPEPSPSPEPTEDPSPEELASEVEVDEEPEEVVTEEEEYELTEEDMRTGVFPIVFESGRDGVIEILEDMFVVESVDRFVYDGESGTVQLSVTPAFDYDEGVRDDSWEIMRAFSELYTEESWIEETRTFIPALEVDISTAHYRCDGETMVALAEARLSRSEWDAACRVS